MSRPRRLAVLWNRWIGLALAGFLTVVGLTGAAIAWNDEGERVFAPVLFVLPSGLAHLSTAGLSLTGVFIWWRKRRARRTRPGSRWISV